MPRITLSDRVVGARIKEARRRKGLLQSDLAADIGVHPTMVSMWEIGALPLPNSRIQFVADALGIPAAGLYPSDFMEVTPDERGLLEAYRRIGANPAGKASIHRVMAAIETARGSAATC